MTLRETPSLLRTLKSQQKWNYGPLIWIEGDFEALKMRIPWHFDEFSTH